MHQEMAQYVLHASASVEGSGRRIRRWDWPMHRLSCGLQAGLDDSLAMSTEAYLEQAHGGDPCVAGAV